MIVRPRIVTWVNKQTEKSRAQRIGKRGLKCHPVDPFSSPLHSCSWYGQRCRAIDTHFKSHRRPQAPADPAALTPMLRTTRWRAVVLLLVAVLLGVCNAQPSVFSDEPADEEGNVAMSPPAPVMVDYCSGGAVWRVGEAGPVQQSATQHAVLTLKQLI